MISLAMSLADMVDSQRGIDFRQKMLDVDVSASLWINLARGHCVA